MSAVRLDAIVSAAAWEGGLDPDRVGQDKLLIIRFINDTRRELYELPINWTGREWIGQFQSVGNVTAGTVKATQNQAEVTGTSTSFTTAMSGRYIQVATGAWQRIAYASDTTHLTLETPWGGDTVTAQSYTIWSRHYLLPAKAERITELVDLSNANTPIAYYPPWEFYRKFGLADTFSAPDAYTVFSSRELGYAYLESTVFTSVSVTANSPIVDFASTAQISTALAPGDRLVIGDSTTSTAFYLDRMLTDTKAMLRTFIPQTIAAASATAQSLDRPLLQFSQSPNNNSTVFMFKAYKSFADLVSNGDFLEPGWYPAVKKGTIAKIMGYSNSPKEPQKLAEYEEEKRILMRSQFRAKNPAPRLKPVIKDRYGGALWGYDADRDTGY